MNELLKRLMKSTQLWSMSPWTVYFADEGGGDGGGGGGDDGGDTGGDDKGSADDKGGDKGSLLDQPVSPVGPDGKFIEGWRDLAPDDMKELVKDAKSLETVTDFWNGIKQLVHHKSMVGADTVKVPGKKATDEEWGEFFSAIGRPKTAGDYKVEIPEELEEVFTKERLDKAQELAFQIGATQKQYEAFMQREVENVKAVIAEEERLLAEARDNAEKALKDEFKGAFDERMHVANRLIAEAFPKEEEKMEFLEEFGNNPNFIRFASRIGARMSESTALVEKLTQKTPSEALSRIKELQNMPGYTALDGSMTSDEKARITAEIRELYKQVYPDSKSA